MKQSIRLIVFILLCANNLLCASYQQPNQLAPQWQQNQMGQPQQYFQPNYFQPPSQPVVVNVHNASASTSSPNVTSSATVTPPRPPTTPFTNNFIDFLHTITDYKHTFINTMLLGAYCLTYYQIFLAHDLMSDKNSWGQWKAHIKFEQLCTMPQDKLFDELAFEIALRYINVENVSDASYLLKSFFDDINAEQKILKRYLRITKLLNKLYLSWTFFASSKKMRLAKRHIKRIRFFKSAILSRIAQQTYLNLIPRTNGKYVDLFSQQKPFGRPIKHLLS